MRVMKTYLNARYRLLELLRAQRNDRMTSNLKRWIENGSPYKGDLEEDSYRILRQYFMQKEGRLYLNKDGIVACKRREEDRVLHKYKTTDSEQIGQIYLGEEELKVRRIGHDAMMEQDAVHIGYEADVTAHLLDTNGKKIGVTGLLDTAAVVSVMPIKT